MFNERKQSIDNSTWNDIEVAPRSAVMQSAKQFAEILSETPQFREFEQSYFNFRQDTEAQNAIQEFQKKQASLKALLMLNAVSDEDRQDLQRLQERFAQQPSVLRYTNAQEELIKMCLVSVDQLLRAYRLCYGEVWWLVGCCG